MITPHNCHHHPWNGKCQSRSPVRVTAMEMPGSVAPGAENTSTVKACPVAGGAGELRGRLVDVWRRAWWTAGVAVIVGAGMWALLRFGALSWLGNDQHPARPVIEGLSWLAGIGGLVVAVWALMVARRQNQTATATGTSLTQTATGGGVVWNGDVTGGSGSGPTIGMNFGQAGGPPGPTGPTRGQAQPRRSSGPQGSRSPEA